MGFLCVYVSVCEGKIAPFHLGSNLQRAPLHPRMSWVSLYCWGWGPCACTHRLGFKWTRYISTHCFKAPVPYSLPFLSFSLSHTQAHEYTSVGFQLRHSRQDSGKLQEQVWQGTFIEAETLYSMWCLISKLFLKLVNPSHQWLVSVINHYKVSS